jgi:hypothetical protein
MTFKLDALRHFYHLIANILPEGEADLTSTNKPAAFVCITNIKPLDLGVIVMEACGLSVAAMPAEAA